MAPYSLQLPVIQNWSCHNCGGCCREHAITITSAEQERILGQKWTPADGIPAGQELFKVEKTWLGRKQIQLAHQPDGACVFLNEKGLCRIHAKFGEPAKPLACRIYPYAFHPAGNRLTVSLRFSCPSVAGNRGSALTRQKEELRELARLVAPANYAIDPAPKLTPSQQLDWADTLKVVESLDFTLADEDAPLAVKLLRALFWMELVAKSKFQKIQGNRLEELLELLVNAAHVEIPEIPEQTDTPAPIALTQFRLLAGQYARKDTAANIDLTLRGRWKQAKNAMRLARGRGMLPDLGAGLKVVPFDQLEQTSVAQSVESEEMLTRYFRVKLQGMHFCGRAYYNIPVVEGFHSLSLMYPVILWIARWRAATDGRNVAEYDDILFALTLADHQYGYSPLHGQWGWRRRTNNLAATEDLQKLILHYAARE